MGRRAVLAGLAVLVTVLVPDTSDGGQATACTFSALFTLSPGLAVEPNSGTFTSHGERGQMTCDAGSGSFGAEGRYGTDDPDACFASGEGTAVQTWTIQMAGGRTRETNVITFTYGVLAAGGAISGHFSGPRFSGTFEVMPTKGDCVTAPVTEVSLQGKGTMRR
jgi:hypothetical protein